MQEIEAHRNKSQHKYNDFVQMGWVNQSDNELGLDHDVKFFWFKSTDKKR